MPAPGRGPAASGDEIVYGWRAGLAAIERRPQELVAVTCIAPLRLEVEAALRRADVVRVSVTVADEERLAALAASKHHEGLVVATKPRRFVSAADLTTRLAQRGGVAVALDRVRNPYNVGAILRTAAFFGLEAAVLGAPAPHPALHPDAVRVAEGGVELLAVSRTTDLAVTLRRLREAGVLVLGAESKGGEAPARFRRRRPAVLVVGHEREGLAARVRAECDALVCVPGAGHLDSLNVAVATGVLLAELVRG